MNRDELEEKRLEIASRLLAGILSNSVLCYSFGGEIKGLEGKNINELIDEAVWMADDLIKRARTQ